MGFVGLIDMFTKLRSIRLKYCSFYLNTSSNRNYTGQTMTNPIQKAMHNKLKENLEPSHMEIINESYMHNVPKGAETHFKVVVISEKFDGLPLIKRHRLVNEILKSELENGVHALSIVAKTPDQWQDSDKIVESSPNCRGGFGK